LQPPLYLANGRCSLCAGTGDHSVGRKPQAHPVCRCVYRAIFRQCLAAYFKHPNPGPSSFSRDAEYRADFCLIAKRVLVPRDLKILVEHLLGDNPYRPVAAAVSLDKGNFFHRVYAIEERVGRAFLDAAPHSVWPVAAYFKGEAFDRDFACRFHLAPAGRMDFYGFHRELALELGSLPMTPAEAYRKPMRRAA
jgi:hypothetical protein